MSEAGTLPVAQPSVLGRLDAGWLPLTERLQKWTEATARFLVPLRISSFTETVNGSISAVESAGVTVCRVRASAHDAVRTPALLSPGDTRRIKFAIPLSRRVTVGQDDRRVTLPPGQMCLYRTTRPYSVGSDGPLDLAIVMVDEDAVPLEEGEIDELAATSLAGSQLHRIRDTLLRAGKDGISESERDRALDRLVTVRSAGSSIHGDRHLSLRSDAERLIHQRLHDPRLDPERIAAALGVSKRTLQDTFSREGRSVTGTIRHRRLDVARHLLVQHGNAVSVSEVAAQTGFRSLAGFSRLFRSEFGIPPSQLRDGV